MQVQGCRFTSQPKPTKAALSKENSVTPYFPGVWHWRRGVMGLDSDGIRENKANLKRFILSA